MTIATPNQVFYQVFLHANPPMRGDRARVLHTNPLALVLQQLSPSPNVHFAAVGFCFAVLFSSKALALDPLGWKGETQNAS
jgi:hypothetical protein